MEHTQEPIISVGIMRHACITFQLKGCFLYQHQLIEEGTFEARLSGQLIITPFACSEKIELIPASNQATFVLHRVKIGINFHWEQEESQEFEGILKLQAEDGAICAVNRVQLEKYLKSVISSEMNAMNDLNLLKAHAIVSRSWLMAQLMREPLRKPHAASTITEGEIIRWYDREDHLNFDVCADDHCQRYQGISKIISANADEAVRATRGQFLLHNDSICDARFSKCCGAYTENFENAWQPVEHAYLTSIYDGPTKREVLPTNQKDFYTNTPEAFCNTSDPAVLQQVLIDFDRTTHNFYRWKVERSNEELRHLLLQKSGIDFGEIIDMVPLERGKSGRIIRLKIVGSKHSIVVGKELEIRKWLSESHLYSSAFWVEKNSEPSGLNAPGFILYGAGWGHGVGMCQIGAAVMSRQGFQFEEILQHYFKETQLVKLYE